MERYDGKTKKDDYRRYALIVVLAAALVIALFLFETLLVPKEPETDFAAVFAYSGGLKAVDAEKLDSIIKEAAGDVNGDGQTVVTVYYRKLDPKSDATATDYALADMEALMYGGGALPSGSYTASSLKQSATLFLLTEQPDTAIGFYGLSLLYCGRDCFLNLFEFGLEADERHPTRLKVEGEPLAAVGLGDVPVFASIRDWDEGQTSAALRVIEALSSKIE